MVKTVTRKSGGAAKAIAGLDYDARVGDHTGRRDELELEGGRDRAEMAEILLAAESANDRANGKIALDMAIELPATATADQRRQIAEALAAWMESRGCPAHWAIHARNEAKQPQPHLHLTTTARPVHLVDGAWVGTPVGAKGRPGAPPLIAGPAEMQRFRRVLVAGAVNQVCGLNWHGGRLEETGIDRPAKARLPMAVYKRLQADPAGPAHTNAMIDAGAHQEVVQARKAWVKAQQRVRTEKAAQEARKREERAREKGFVPKTEADEWKAKAFEFVKKRNEKSKKVKELEAVVAELKSTQANRAADLEPATGAQMKIVVDLQRKTGMDILHANPEIEMNKGNVGKLIRILEQQAKTINQQPARRQPKGIDR
ncbi:MAG: hypothetical protein HQL40_17840 [Alphaproteobacteria bacterium]|nr:hypothetical protein [Alphaproteobacteria bacterium]